MHLHFIVVFVLVSLALEQAKFVLGSDEDVYFVYGSPGGGGRSAGVFGGSFNSNKSPNNLNLEQTRIDEGRFGNSWYNGIAVSGLSYDPVSKKLLMLTESGTLAKIDRCINKIDEDFYFDGYSYFDLHTGPFALYDSNVYYVSQTSHIKDRSIVVSLTIRKMTGCHDRKQTFMRKNGYDDRKCSVEVAKILEETIFTMENPKFKISPGLVQGASSSVQIIGTTLSVVKYENKLHFLVQVAKPLSQYSERSSERALHLYETKEGGEAKLLHTTVSSKWPLESIPNIGDISYKDGLLCWSAFESVFCGKWNFEGKVSGVYEVIKPGDAVRVCSVSTNHQEYQNILTGIEIVSVKDKISIIFGCWASWGDEGGAGYLTANSDWSNIQMKKISDKGGPIRAGKLAITDGCPASSRREVDTEFNAFW